MPYDPSMDYCGRLVLNNGGAVGITAANACIIPLRRSSRIGVPSGAQGEGYAAGGVLEAFAWTEGQTAPVLVVQTHLWEPLAAGRNTWFQATWLHKMGLEVPGASRPAATGMLGDLGHVYWQYGNTPAMSWTSCKLDSLTLRWGDVGEAVEATLVLRPYGPKMAFDTAATAALPVYNRYYMGKGLTYSGIARVHQGIFTFNNNLQPDFSSPAVVNDADSEADGVNDIRAYPREYFPGMPTWSLSLTQDADTSDENPAVDPSVAAVGSGSIVFTGPTGGNVVTFAFKALAPDKTQELNDTVSLTTRNYSNIRTAAAASLVVS